MYFIKYVFYCILFYLVKYVFYYTVLVVTDYFTKAMFILIDNGVKTFSSAHHERKNSRGDVCRQTLIPVRVGQIILLLQDIIFLIVRG